MNGKTMGPASLLVLESLNGWAAPKVPHAARTKTAGAMVVKYKAHCGMVYSAEQAKKYHYVCPMDHKPS